MLYVAVPRRHFAETMLGQEHEISLAEGAPITKLLLAILKQYGSLLTSCAAMLHFALYEKGGAFLLRMMHGEHAVLGACLQLALLIVPRPLSFFIPPHRTVSPCLQASCWETPCTSKHAVA